MKFAIMLVLTFAFGLPASAKCVKKPVVIAVIDTGFGYNNRGHEAKLCRFGHKDFTGMNEFSTGYKTKDPVPSDNHSHGTNIVGLIDKYAGQFGTNYCVVVLKYWDPTKKNINYKSSLEAIKYATRIKADFINFSGGGTDFIKPEADAVKKYLDNGGKFIAAAGNEDSDIDESPYYPAMDDKRTVIVGNMNEDGEIEARSNYGDSVKRWEVGVNAFAYGVMLTGTSQSTAIATGKIVSEIKSCKPTK